MNIAGLAIDRRAIPMTLEIKGVATYDTKGKAVKPAPTTTSIKAVIQPARGVQLMDMPEGLRAEAGWIMWSRSELSLDNVIIHKGARYRVLFVWPRDEGVFYRAALGLLK